MDDPLGKVYTEHACRGAGGEGRAGQCFSQVAGPLSLSPGHPLSSLEPPVLPQAPPGPPQDLMPSNKLHLPALSEAGQEDLHPQAPAKWGPKRDCSACPGHRMRGLGVEDLSVEGLEGLGQQLRSGPGAPTVQVGFLLGIPNRTPHFWDWNSRKHSVTCFWGPARS